MDVDLQIGGDCKMPAADSSEGKIDTAFSKYYYLAAISYYLTTHNNIPADNCPQLSASNRGMNRGSMPSNKNLCGDAAKLNGEFTNGFPLCYYLIT